MWVRMREGEREGEWERERANGRESVGKERQSVKTKSCDKSLNETPKFLPFGETEIKKFSKIGETFSSKFLKR